MAAKQDADKNAKEAAEAAEATDEGGRASLDGVHLLESAGAAEKKSLARMCSWRNYAADEHIIDRQSDTRDVYFVISGTVRVVNYSLSGKEVTLDDLEAGGSFGELAALDGRSRSAAVIALENTHIAAIPHERFLSFIARHPKAALYLMRRLAWIIRTSTDRIMDLSTLAANNRVQAELLRLAKLDADDDSARISPMPVHNDIASRVSTTRETVARVLGDLQKQGIVERQKDGLTIPDISVLRDMVEEERGE